MPYAPRTPTPAGLPGGSLRRARHGPRTSTASSTTPTQRGPAGRLSGKESKWQQLSEPRRASPCLAVPRASLILASVHWAVPSPAQTPGSPSRPPRQSEPHCGANQPKTQWVRRARAAAQVQRNFVSGSHTSLISAVNLVKTSFFHSPCSQQPRSASAPPWHCMLGTTMYRASLHRTGATGMSSPAANTTASDHRRRRKSLPLER